MSTMLRTLLRSTSDRQSDGSTKGSLSSRALLALVTSAWGVGKKNVSDVAAVEPSRAFCLHELQLPTSELFVT